MEYLLKKWFLEAKIYFLYKKREKSFTDYRNTDFDYEKVKREYKDHCGDIFK